jgi:hypothetical protein
MKQSLLISILSIFSFAIQAKGVNTQAPKLVIERTYTRNKEIWGTYRQVSEKGSAYAQGRKVLLKNQAPIGDMIIQNGQVIFIRTLDSDLEAAVAIEGFPYKKRGGNFDLETEELVQREGLFRHFGKEIEELALKHPKLKTLSSEKLRDLTRFDSLSCERTKERNLACTLEITLDEPRTPATEG